VCMRVLKTLEIHIVAQPVGIKVVHPYMHHDSFIPHMHTCTVIYMTHSHKVCAMTHSYAARMKTVTYSYATWQ